MKKKLFFICFTLLVSTLFVGCGTKLIEMDEAQEEAFVSYSAAVVAKYNKNMSSGLISVYDPVDKKSETETELNIEEPVEETTEVVEISDETPATQDDGTVEEPVLEEPEPTTSSITLTEYLGYPGVTFEVSGTEVSDSYKSGNYMALMPNSGNSYLVVRVYVNNTSGSDVNLDLYSKNITYQATVNGTQTTKSDTTILLNDLATYEANLKAGSDAELVLLFQYETSVLENMNSLSIRAVSDGNATEIIY